MDDVRYVIAVIVIACVPPTAVWWFLVHPFVSFWRRVRPVKTILTMSVLMTLEIVGLIYVRDWLVLTDYGTHAPVFVLAAALLALSIWIWLMRSEFLTFDILVGIPELEEGGHGGQLLKDGIYRRIRHPRYVEIAVGTLAYATFSNYLGAYIAALALLPMLHLVVLLEERELHARFGEQYELYCKRVPRYIPRIL